MRACTCHEPGIVSVSGSGEGGGKGVNKRELRAYAWFLDIVLYVLLIQHKVSVCVSVFQTFLAMAYLLCR